MDTILFIWQLPQNLVGLLLFAFYKRGSRDMYYHGVRVRVNRRFHSGISLGRYILLRKITRWNRQHEYGHAVQSMRWGWLYLPVVGLCSLLHNLFGEYKRNPAVDYYHYWTERQADRLGGVKRK